MFQKYFTFKYLKPEEKMKKPSGSNKGKKVNNSTKKTNQAITFH